jgi:hypothetical protein
MKVRFTELMSFIVETPHGEIAVKWRASAWKDHVSYAVAVDAPFLLVPLRVGVQGFSDLASVLNLLLQDENKANGLLEFLELAALGSTTHWLRAFRQRGLEATLSDLRKKFRNLEKYRKLAWDLKKNGFVLCENKLLVRGEKAIHGVQKGQKAICPLILYDNLHPAILKNIVDAQLLERTYATPIWKEDGLARANLRRALEEIREPWVRELEADVVASAISG